MHVLEDASIAKQLELTCMMLMIANTCVGGTACSFSKAQVLQPGKRKAENDKENLISGLLNGKWLLELQLVSSNYYYSGAGCLDAGVTGIPGMAPVSGLLGRLQTTGQALLQSLSAASSTQGL